MRKSRFVPLADYREYTPEEMKKRAAEFYKDMQRRRSIRHFSERQVPREVIKDCIRVSGTAPSGANMQPWHFVVVTDPEVKRVIRKAAEEEEHNFYKNRASQEWLEALVPLGTDEHKFFLETAPYLIVIFEKRYGLLPDGSRIRYYYTNESVGIATGMLITAIHKAGLVSLTYTPSPMDFLNEILNRPPNERAFLILIVGYPADDAVVPGIQRKPLEEIATFIY